MQEDNAMYGLLMLCRSSTNLLHCDVSMRSCAAGAVKAIMQGNCY